MFSKILIANRGEIACRIIKTCRKLGIKTVAVYSEADAEGLHVRMADEAVAIGPSASAQSYLVIDKIVAACKQTGAQAVHPGFGFLSEKAEFAERLAREGIVFIGPPPGAIAAMGDKIESKKLAAEAGVNTVPGTKEAIADEGEALRIAREIGYPVMIKASAGGGGKGMRVVHNDDQFSEGFRSARNEARASFGDDRVFLEKFVDQPRHIEIQVLADGHGNIVHLGERECSVQRRHQKVLEEAPSPFIDAETRAAMGAQACALARAVGYTSAGTVEFIVDGRRNFYFLEMNTRLQVEHPVTELVYGLDLVEWMIRVAAGEALPFRQEQIKPHGWAVEARLYAEDPTRNFLPSTGRLTRFRPPAEDSHVRLDTGVYEGAEISMFYDPMIAKLVGYGGDRGQAIDKLLEALDAFEVRGVQHNVAFLSAALDRPRFREGRLTTAFIAEEFPEGFHGRALDESARQRLLALAAWVHHRLETRKLGLSGRLPHAPRAAKADWVVRWDGHNQPAHVEPSAGGGTIAIGGQSLLLKGAWRPGQTLFRGEIDGQPVIAQIERRGHGYRISQGGATLDVQVLTQLAAHHAELMPAKVPPDLSRFLLSPMPGLLSAVRVQAGQEVKAGEELCVVEAMKMENVLRAERDGRVAKIHAEAGATLAVDQAILEFA
ncbi:MAG TPA: acetyl/propionyl/methylcrotonyl-CoA carboxylase subunit alpha [Alphaproteobacteria bacterium]|nr:acetyl/propionyl/methylcrotonyl-CoA carboxylase subunit alpha [Alphaproteobacteria bacterium]